MVQVIQKACRDGSCPAGIFRCFIAIVARFRHPAGLAAGSGEINWGKVFKEAQRIGIKYYFIEDEADDASNQIPQSLRYLESAAW